MSQGGFNNNITSANMLGNNTQQIFADIMNNLTTNAGYQGNIFSGNRAATNDNTAITQYGFNNAMLANNAAAGFNQQGYLDLMGNNAANAGLDYNRYLANSNTIDTNAGYGQTAWGNNRSTIGDTMQIYNQQYNNSMGRNDANARLYASMYGANFADNTFQSQQAQQMLNNIFSKNNYNAGYTQYGMQNNQNLANMGYNTANSIFSNGITGLTTQGNFYNNQGNWLGYGLDKQAAINQQKYNQAYGTFGSVLNAANSLNNNSTLPVSTALTTEQAKLAAQQIALAQQQASMYLPFQATNMGMQYGNQFINAMGSLLPTGRQTVSQNDGLGGFGQFATGLMSAALPLFIGGGNGKAASTIIG